MAIKMQTSIYPNFKYRETGFEGQFDRLKALSRKALR